MGPLQRPRCAGSHTDRCVQAQSTNVLPRPSDDDDRVMSMTMPSIGPGGDADGREDGADEDEAFEMPAPLAEEDEMHGGDDGPALGADGVDPDVDIANAERPDAARLQLKWGRTMDASHSASASAPAAAASRRSAKRSGQRGPELLRA